ncbi:MAG: hypothetical protein HN341_14145 [Verrucomicrobia bacterium]|jgi:hypothetical protein|nr:hypothetical protein [Verrucomicrobiota bacterium]
MNNNISWTVRQSDGVKRETRVHVSLRALKWQFKRADQAQWDYDSAPTADDWDMLENVLARRAGRGHAPKVLPAVRKMRAQAGA